MCIALKTKILHIFCKKKSITYFRFIKLSEIERGTEKKRAHLLFKKIKLFVS